MPGAGQKEFEALEIGDVDALDTGQRIVVDGHHEHDVLLEQRLGHEVAPGDGEGQHGQVEAPRRQLGLEAQGGAVGHHEVETGMAGGQIGEERGHEPARRRAEDADPGVAGHGLAQGPDVGHQGVELSHDPVGAGHHDLAVGREPAGRALDQGGAELPLESGHVGRDVGLDRAQMVGGGGERPVLGHRHQGLQVSDLHRFLRYSKSVIAV